MGYIGAVNIVIGATSAPLLSELNRVKAAVTKTTIDLNKQLITSYKSIDAIQKDFTNGIGRVGRELRQAGQMGIVGFTAPIALLAYEAGQSYAQLERLEKGINNVDKATELAKITMREFVQLAKLPGLGIQEVNEFYLKMKGVKTSTEDTFRYIRAFGGAVARSGGGKEQFGGIGVQLAQMLTKKSIEAQDLKSIFENSPNIGSVVMDLYGTVDSREITEQLAKAGKSTRDFVEDVVGALEKMDPVASGFANSLENLTDGWFLFKAEVGRAVDESIGATSKLDALGNSLTSMAGGIKDSEMITKQFVVGLVGITAATPVVILGLGLITTYLSNPFRLAFTNGLALMGRFGTGIAALANPFTIGAAAATAFVYTLYSYNEAVKTTIDEKAKLNEVSVDATKQYAVEKSKLEDLLRVANDKNKSLTVREEAMSRINQLDKELLGNLTLEEIGTEKGKDALLRYNKALEANIRLTVLRNKIAQLASADEVINKDLGFGEVFLANLNPGGFAKGIVDIRKGEISRLSKEKKLYEDEINKILDDPTYLQLNSGGGSGSSSKIEDEGADRIAEKLKEDRIKLEKETQEEIARLRAEANDNEFRRQQELNEINFQETIAAKVREYKEAKMPFDKQYFEWLRLQAEKLRRENFEEEKRFLDSLTPELLNQDTIKMGGVSIDRKDIAENMPLIGTSKDFGESLKNIDAYIIKLGEMMKAQKNVSAATEDWKAKMIEALKAMSIQATADISAIIGEMIVGTKKVEDLTVYILEMLADILKQMAIMNISTGLVQLATSKGTKGWGKLATGIGAGVGSGIVSGTAKKREEQIKQNGASQRYSATTTTVIRGTDIVRTTKRTSSVYDNN